MSEATTRAGRDVIVGLDAGTSVIKAVAFDLAGRQLGATSRPNLYRTLPNGGAEQDMATTWVSAAAVLRELGDVIPDLARRILTVAVTGQGDGTWLVDAAGEPLHDGWLWLDGRAVAETRRLADGPGGRLIYERTGSGLNVCQLRTQLLHMLATTPALVAEAACAFHCKDFLYLRLTGTFATDVPEAVFTFGDFRTRQYDPEVVDACGLTPQRHLMPPIVDGVRTAHPLTAAAAAATGLPEGMPVVLAYLDVVCACLGAGLYDPDVRPALSILGSTGAHMRFAADADAVVLNEARSGYTMPLPGGGYAQMQTNMAATLNIDWLLNVGCELLASVGNAKTRADLLVGLDDRVLAARPGAALYHPYISAAGERGPFAEPDARASFTGLDQTVGWFDLMRAVYEGLAFAARDCYAIAGDIPSEIRLTGGAARSTAMRQILAAVLDRPVRTVRQPEAGAVGAAMIAAVQQGVFPDVAAAAKAWIDPLLNPPEAPDAGLTATYDRLFDAYVDTRAAMAPAWTALANARTAAPETIAEAAQ